MTQTMTRDAGVLATLREVVDQASAGRVFGEPITTADGTIVLPVARVGGGGGGGGGTAPAEDGKENGGAGGGFSISAKPLGVFVIRDRGVSWRPAVDVNKIILGGQLVAVTALLVARAVVKARAARRR
ncbi:sporulation protein YtfJ [Krasilnikovia cinnamomea]|uniref:Sporulation protein YtfJ n=1 Tax=Krasilnikovia cinnamomea TaxID=349313 RepID=A0A4Q7ZE26_9ACTN|nr:spore germination protein GerW family protein [Krasilnikovia cinnamomea]RZU48315.1 sporulation protein YtfJ [Krasilnikovia cinnamomea]